MVALTIHSSLDERRIEVGAHCSLGRAGDVRMATDAGGIDLTLHAEALYIANLGDRWSAQVPDDGAYQAVVSVEGDHAVVAVGEERTFRHTAACRDRLARPGAGALHHHEVAAILAGSTRGEDSGLNDGGARKRASRVRSGAIGGWLESCGDGDPDRDDVVDLLVRRGVVTAATYQAALG